MKNILLFYLFLSVGVLSHDWAFGQHSPSSRFVYADVSLGYARAEDGVARLSTITTLTQMVPAARVGLGYRLGRYLSVEGYFSSMLTRFSAGGPARATSRELLIEPRYQAFGANLVAVLPLRQGWEIVLAAGPASLRQQARISEPGTSATQSVQVNAGGYCVSPGVRKYVSDAWAVQFRFDFMDQFGSDEVWRGDLGTAFLGVNYRFGKTTP